MAQPRPVEQSQSNGGTLSPAHDATRTGMLPSSADNATVRIGSWEDDDRLIKHEMCWSKCWQMELKSTFLRDVTFRDTRSGDTFEVKRGYEWDRCDDKLGQEIHDVASGQIFSPFRLELVTDIASLC
ncbi:hypothetical protein I302_106481 [Kwoniella bestiolae CBS 10118]|uniref:Uncharacterized protein n=1 Tax=Kwoniella bestiolae CBS 10118 TaxID=1296100 RepID=A0A1B9G1B7_9TREE|nr:hypothetical protein I302_06262 [Kwoniella bestiolae CBS 10118]OCF24801.1 hypothetical protein I302_06262 [Kwoniella bestiolae CBS 10118]